MQQGAGPAVSMWDDLEVDPDTAYVIYQNPRDEPYIIQVQESGKEPYICTLIPDSTTVLSFNRAGGVVKTWNFRNGEWRKSFDFFLRWPDVQWIIPEGKPLPPKLQRERAVVREISRACSGEKRSAY